MEKKCIYCGLGKSDDVTLSESDIIPIGLTNCVLKNKNVCTLKHNNIFGKTFESEIINKLNFIRNKLNFKNRDNNFVAYEQSYIINADVFNIKGIYPNRKLGKQIISSINKDGNKILQGPHNDIIEIAKSKGISENKIEKYRIEDKEIIEQNEIESKIFFCNSIFRLMAKIAYEWFCKTHTINDKINNYDRIIKFILNESNDNVVEIVSDKIVYEKFDEQFEIGSHVLLEYSNNNGNLYVYIYFFTTLIYKILICSTSDNLYKINNINFLECKVSGKKHEIRLDINYMNTMPLLDNSFYEQLNLLEIVYSLESENSKLPRESIFLEILQPNIFRLLNTIFLTTNFLKKIINGYEDLLNSKEKISLINSDELLFGIFVLFLIGKQDSKINDENLFTIKNSLSYYISIELTSSISKKMKEDMMQDKNAILYIKKGINLILQ